MFMIHPENIFYTACIILMLGFVLVIIIQPEPDNDDSQDDKT